MSSLTNVLKYMLGGGFIGFVVVMIVFASLIRDTSSITRYPDWFTMEILVLSTISVIPFVFIAYSRSRSFEAAVSPWWKLLLTGLFPVFMHVSFQLCGFYGAPVKVDA